MGIHRDVVQKKLQLGIDKACAVWMVYPGSKCLRSVIGCALFDQRRYHKVTV